MVVRVALVNDHEVVVRGLAAMLRNYGKQLEVLQLCCAGPITETVDVALYDTFGMARGGHDRVAQLIANPRVRAVAIYTWNFHSWLTEKSLSMGVQGYLSKSLTSAQLAKALVAIAAGETVVSPPFSHAPVVSGDWPGREEGLSEREAEVLSLISLGLSNPEIAEHTFLAPNSVKSSIRSIYRKIDVDSRSLAVLWGIDHGLRAQRVCRRGAHGTV